MRDLYWTYYKRSRTVIIDKYGQKAEEQEKFVQELQEIAEASMYKQETKIKQNIKQNLLWWRQILGDEVSCCFNWR